MFYLNLSHAGPWTQSLELCNITEYCLWNYKTMIDMPVKSRAFKSAYTGEHETQVFDTMVSEVLISCQIVLKNMLVHKMTHTERWHLISESWIRLGLWHDISFFFVLFFICKSVIRNERISMSIFMTDVQ